MDHSRSLTWAEDIEAFALGELGLKPDEFEELTLREYYFISEGYWIRHEREWDRIRYMAACIFNARPGVERIHMLNPEDIMQLPRIDKGTARARKKVIIKTYEPEQLAEVYRKFGFKPPEKYLPNSQNV